MSFTIKAAVLATVLYAASLPANANFILNGNFDLPHANVFSFFSNGQVPGWTNTLSTDGIEIDDSNIAIGGAAYPGTSQSAEVNGNTYDWISQTISGLTVGAHYTLSWAYGDRPGYGAQKMDVYFGDGLVSDDGFVTSNTSSGNGPFLVWTFNSFDVVAMNTNETLTFKARNVGGASDGGNELTAVSLVPEPASIALFGLGLMGFAMSRRKMAKTNQA